MKIKSKKILIINICKEKLHYYEFVKPVENILENMKKEKKIDYFVKNYKKVNEKDLKKASKIIICGTSLADNEFIDNKNISKFKWLLNYKKPVLGICGGMEIMGKVFGGKLLRKTEIGYYSENFKKEFLSLKGKKEFYHLHNYYVDFRDLDFEVFCENNGIVQAVKHMKKSIYGVLFHPEVRQNSLIKFFCLL